MLQRSPTYIIAWPDEDAIANTLRRYLPSTAACTLTRWKNVLAGMYFYWLCRKRPERAKAMILDGVRAALGPDYDVATHFRPHYNPWDQRLCLIPNGDLFKSIRQGATTVVTDEIETFVETGVRLRSGRELEADLIVTATGLNLQLMGGAEIEIDGQSNSGRQNNRTERGFRRRSRPNTKLTHRQAILMRTRNAAWQRRSARRDGVTLSMGREGHPSHEGGRGAGRAKTQWVGHTHPPGDELRHRAGEATSPDHLASTPS